MLAHTDTQRTQTQMHRYTREWQEATEVGVLTWLRRVSAPTARPNAIIKNRKLKTMTRADAPPFPPFPIATVFFSFSRWATTDPIYGEHSWGCKSTCRSKVRCGRLFSDARQENYAWNQLQYIRKKHNKEEEESFIEQERGKKNPSLVQEAGYWWCNRRLYVELICAEKKKQIKKNPCLHDWKRKQEGRSKSWKRKL